MLNAAKIAVIINEAYDGVERSKLGQIIEETTDIQRFPDGKKFNKLPYDAFITVLNSLLPKDIKGDMKVDDK